MCFNEQSQYSTSTGTTLVDLGVMTYWSVPNSQGPTLAATCNFSNNSYGRDEQAPEVERQPTITLDLAVVPAFERVLQNDFGLRGLAVVGIPSGQALMLASYFG